MEPLYQILPLVGAALFGVASVAAALRPSVSWKIPAVVSVLFLGWSIYAIGSGGQTGFWIEHTRNAWGNQIWFDLLIGIGIAWTLLVPRARAVGMRPWLWLTLIALTGGIGLTAMFARCRYLETRST